MSSQQLETIYNWWLQYLTGLVGVSSLGASITFGVLTTSKIELEPQATFSSGTVRTLLAVVFLLFLVTIGCSHLLNSLLFFEKDGRFSDDDTFRQAVGICGLHIPYNTVLHICNLAITSTLFAAFVVLALVVVAYTEVVGWLTLGIIGLYVLVYLYFWYGQL